VPGTDRKSPAIPYETLLAALLSSPTTVLLGAKPDGTIDLWSAGATALYGWTAQEVLGRPLTVLTPADRVHELDARNRVYQGESLPPFETVRVARDGTQIPVEIHLVAVADGEGQSVRTLALHSDLRRVRRAEAALGVTREQLRARFDTSPVPQARVDLQGRVLAVNDALAQLMGIPSEALVGQDGMTYLATDRRELEANLARIVSGEEAYSQREHELRRRDGSTVRVVTTTTLVREPDGEQVLAVSVEDVTALRAAEDQLRIEAGRFDALVQSMPVAVFSYDEHGICTSSRGQALRHLGLRDGELVGSSLLETYADDPVVVDALRATLDGRNSTLRADVAGRSWEGHYRPLLGPDGRVVGGIGVAIDLTERAAAEREVAANEARLRSLLRYAADIALVVDPGGVIVFASAAVRVQLGYDEADLVGKQASQFNHPEDRRVIASSWRSVLRRYGATARFECRVLHADGTWRWADHVMTNLLDDPVIGGIVVNVKETTERRRAEEELRRLAVRDSVTGLANRTLLLDRAEQSLVAGRRSGAASGLVVLDVIGMTSLNERLGQDGGDDLLRAVAARLEATVRPTDTVARIAGDEFAVLMGEFTSEEELRARTAALLEAMEEPVLVGSRPVPVRLRTGTALSPAADAGALLAAAEHAAVLTSGISRLVVQSPGSSEGSMSESELRQAIRGGELVLHYQPVVRLADDVVLGAEALVRWQHPQRGLLLPGEFIPLAERSGLVVELGAWVLREACAQTAAWLAAGRRLAVGINLSPRQLIGSHFLDLVGEVLAEHALPPRHLVLEVTESAVMDDPGAPGVLRALHDMGIRLALDDFGTGYSSLTYLKRFPIDAIKIDRSFVSGLGRDNDDAAIVASVISLGRAVGKAVVAEGVESAEQLRALCALGVDQAQGFLWSRALPAEDFARWLDTPRAVPAAAPAPTAVPLPVPTVGDDEARILELHREGASLHTIAAALNAEGRRTPGGPRWTTKTVARVVAALVPPG
jgi:diguanylate cyclase (GGDEF)-like protein/PAS domain S-box-containing protein